MAILAIDTSCNTGSVALRADDGSIVSRSFEGDQRHSSALFPELEALGIQQAKIDQIIVGLGPGSFSGIRVAIAAAQAIALAKSCSVVGVCSAWSVAMQKKHVTRLGVFADARRGERYLTIFANGKMERETFLVPNDSVEELVSKFTETVCADPVPLISEKVIPAAKDFLSLDSSFQGWISTDPLEPIYLREPVVGT
ncbi:MAG: tRNA (adenosine(37)-N6)-threonylcarbamoyltransferase complex dimerization subunit type 1 TsaB [Verrucomicrobiota bacterium]